jgi:NAD(P)-dependent dehydrogenase (short-subunit alcohol dehydrogenase family)
LDPSIYDKFDISGKVAIVTGASSGLGTVYARGLAAAGSMVVLAARRKDRLKKLVSELSTGGAQALAVGCDVAREDEVARLVEATMDRFGRLDILVNNAGIVNNEPAEAEDLNRFRQVMDINLTGTFICAQHCGRVMLRAGHGSIVNIASIMGLIGIGTIPQASYNASKAAVVNLTRELAAQWAKRGVRVNALAPGYFPSEMTAPLFEDERSQNFLRRRIPMWRLGDPEELLGPLLLLASDASSYITGHTLVVDGGYTII